jgi:oligosaccharyltransferase complex subunit delta (ribophorin II)
LKLIILFPTHNITTMRFVHSFVPSLLLLAAGAAQAASSWGFEDGSLTVSSKKADGAVKEK